MSEVPPKERFRDFSRRLLFHWAWHLPPVLRFCGTLGLVEQAHDLLVRDLLEVSVPEADGFEVVGHEQADQIVRLGA